MYQLLLLKKECDHTMNQYNSEVSKDKGQSLGHLEYKAEKLNGSFIRFVYPQELLTSTLVALVVAVAGPRVRAFTLNGLSAFCPHQIS